MLLRDLVIRPEDIETEFHPKYRNLADFKELVLVCDDPNVRQAGDVSRKMGLSRTKDRKRYAAARRSYVKWIFDQNFPYAVQAILDLYDLGLFSATRSLNTTDTAALLLAKGLIAPFDYQNTRLRLATIICAAAFWRGTVPVPGTSDGGVEIYNHFEDADLDKIVSKWIDQSASTQKDGQRLRLRAALSKFIKLLSNYRGRKTEMAAAFPMPIEAALHSWETSTDIDERTKAFEIISNFILAFFAGDKVKHSASRGFSAIFPFNLERAVADTRVELFQKALKITRPDLRTKITAAHQQGHIGREKTTYSHIVQFPSLQEAEVEDLKNQFRRSVRKCI